MPYRIGVDIGGTFTDFAVIDDATGHPLINKQLTTPEDPSVAVLEGIAQVLGEHGIAMSEVTAVVHGTTLVTNAIIERRGAPTGLLVTRGMKDLLEIRRERRYDLFDLRLVFPAPLIPREMRREISARMRHDGSVLRPLDMDEAATAVRELVDTHRITAIAVCLLHSYADPAHEVQIADWIRQAFPGLYVSTSAQVFPFMREYDRWTTTIMNAYVQPLADRYLDRLESRLRETGFTGQLYIMTSSGGTVTPATARLYPIRLLESGPAAGALMSAFHGRNLRLDNLLSFDMGGTTAKGTLVRNGRPLKKYEMEVARVHEFKPGSGFPAKVPVLDMIEIGAGGGSIAEVDERGVIRVGPKSAGAMPGPACYGRGGDQPTLTDANLVLGYLDPGFFLGGRMALDRAAAERAIDSRVGAGLDLNLTRASWGIHEIINEDVARSFRVHASENAFDYRTSTMVAFGGSGPMHAARIARKLRVPRVIFPFGAGVMSAMGLLISPLSFDVVRSHQVTVEGLDDHAFARIFAPLEREVADLMAQSGVDRDDVVFIRTLDMRYVGQGYEIEVRVPESGRVADIPAAFAAAYAAVFSSITLAEPLEIVNWKLEGTAPMPGAETVFRLKDMQGTGAARKGARQAYFPEAEGYVECPVYDRYRLAPGARLAGPALIEERESTCVIGMGDAVAVDAHYNLIVDVTGSEAAR